MTGPRRRRAQQQPRKRRSLTMMFGICKKARAGNGRIGVLPDWCDPRGRSRRAVRQFAAMPSPGRLRQQSSRHS